MDLVTGGLGLIGGLSGLFNDSSNSALNLPTIDTSGISNNLNSYIPQMSNYNLGGQNYGQYSAFLQNAVNNPYSGLPQNVANMFGSSGVGPGLQGLANAGVLGGSVPGLAGAAGSILNAGFDPQNALYNRTQQQVQDQTLANLTNSGLATTPWGAGVLGNTMSNFNIDWQNNLLSRMNQGASGAEGLLGQAGTTAAGALGIAGQAPNTAIGNAMLPWATYNTLNTNPLNILSQGANYGISASQIPQTQIGDWIQYMSGANSANQTALNAETQQFKQNQAFGGQIGGALADLGGAFGLPSSFSGFNFGGGSNAGYYGNIPASQSYGSLDPSVMGPR